MIARVWTAVSVSFFVLFCFVLLSPFLMVIPPATATAAAAAPATLFLLLLLLFFVRPLPLRMYLSSRSGESVESSPQTNGLNAPPHGAGVGLHEQARLNVKPDGAWPAGEELQLPRNRPPYEDQVKTKTKHAKRVYVYFVYY